MDVVKYDTMINLIPDMCLTTQHHDHEDEDIEGCGRLVIDIPDSPDDAVDKTEENAGPNTNVYTNTELRGYQPSVMEREKSTSTQNTTKSPETKCQSVLPNARNIPIKLLLKRSFYSSGNKPNKKRLHDYETENEAKKLNEYESNKKECLPYHKHNPNQVNIQKRIDVINMKYVANDINQRISHRNNTMTVSSEKLNTLNQSIKSHKEKMLSTHTHHSNHVRKQERNKACTEAKHINQEKQNTLSSTKSCTEKETFPTLKHHLNQSKGKQITRVRNLADDVTRSTRNYNNNATSAVSTEKQNIFNEPIECSKKYLLFTHKYHSKQKERKDRTHTIVYDDQRVSPPNNKEDKEKNMCIFDARHSSTPGQNRQTPQRQNRQRISVVSNDFLFRHLSEQETLGRSTGTNTQSQINYDRRCCLPLNQEDLIEYMERQYQLALRENIPLKVNRECFFQKPLRNMPDKRSSEVIHISQKTSSQDVSINTPPVQQKTLSFAKHNHPVSADLNITKNTAIAEDSWNTEKNSGYNILVHRGPDVNRIVITIAKENKSKTNTIDQSCNGDQRVPERINNTSTKASPPSHRKRSNNYKEQSLRSFRRCLPYQHAQRHIRNTVETNTFDPSEHLDNAAFSPHYSYIGNQYELPTTVIENDYTLGTRDYLSPVANGFLPWELHDGRAVALDRITRRSIGTETNIPFNQTEYHLDPRHEHQILQPLNLSRKPLTVNKISYPEIYPSYPLSVQDNY